MAESTTSDIPFRRIGAYEVLAPIAEGGMAVIYLARRLDTPGRLVALKVVRPQFARQSDFLAMFQDEAKIASGLDHPNIISIHEVGKDEGRPFLAMELLRGRALLDAFEACQARGEVFPFELAAFVGARIAAALHYAHEWKNEKGAPQAVVHRDVNPSNILLTFDGAPKLIDFGLAKAMDRVAFTAAGIVKGKLAYLSPEQVQGLPADRRTDIFALGVTLWEITTGKRLFRAESDAETLKRVLKAEVPDPKDLVPEYPPALAAAVKHALARDPKERFSTAAELEGALEACLDAEAGTLEKRVAAWLEERFPPDKRTAPWERVVASMTTAPKEAERSRPPPPPSLAWIEAWDNEKQKITLMHAEVADLFGEAGPPALGGGAPNAAPTAGAASKPPPAPPARAAKPGTSAAPPPRASAPDAVEAPPSERETGLGERETEAAPTLRRAMPAPAPAAADTPSDDGSDRSTSELSVSDLSLAEITAPTSAAEAPEPSPSTPTPSTATPSTSDPSTSAPSTSAAPTVRKTPSLRPLSPSERAQLLERYAIRASQGGDGPGFVRTKLELATLAEAEGNSALAEGHARAALAVEAGAAAGHLLLLRELDGRGTKEANAAALPHVEALAAATAPESVRADLLADRARRLLLAGEDPDAVVAAWERALQASPRQGAALWGLDALLAVAPAPAAKKRRAAHLARMAEAFVAEPKLAAWLLVERAELLDDAGEEDGAAEALTRALGLDPGLGPVRAACVRHASRRQKTPLLVHLLLDEARLEADAARAARLELEAALLVQRRLADGPRARSILERAAARAPTAPAVDERILDELVLVYEMAGEWANARAARRARLRFFSAAEHRVHELRTMATLAERAADLGGALADLQEARSLAPDDEGLTSEHDRILAALGQGPARVELWTREASRRASPEGRARAFVRAARIAESLGQGGPAIELHKAALTAVPGDEEATDELARLLMQLPSGPVAENVRARIALYAHGAEHAEDDVRRIAYLERVALLYEESLGEVGLAAATYEAILARDSARRHARLGLLRTARRAGQGERVARALLDEASEGTGAQKSDRELRAVWALLPVDRRRAQLVLAQLLTRDPGHTEARALETRLAEEDERWDRVAQSLAMSLEHTKDVPTRVRLLLARATVQALRLRAPADALASLRTARELAPAHPAPARAFMELSEATGGPRALRAALHELATTSTTGPERARHLLRIGELDELVFEDDAAASQAYAAAVAAHPEDAWARDRLRRVLERQTRTSPESVTALRTLLGSGTAEERFALATELARSTAEAAPTRALLESVLAEDGPFRIAALRTLETLARRTGDLGAVAVALEALEASFGTDPPRAAALWAWASTQPALDRLFFERLLVRAPEDRAALLGLLARALRDVREGDDAARETLGRGFEALLARTREGEGRALVHASLALLLEEGPDAYAKVALGHYREALRQEPRSLLAATGALPLAERFHDDEANVVALLARAEGEAEPTVRAELFVVASGVYTRSEDERLGLPGERRQKAAELLDRALDADPNHARAASLLVALRSGSGERDRLLHALRTTLGRATEPDAIRILGIELARLARGERAELPIAIDALKRVLAVAPTDGLALEMLGELLVFQGAYGAAVAVFESLAGADQGKRRTAALFELAGLYDRLGRPADAEKALRTVLEVEPTSARALRGLVERRRTASSDAASQAELADLLGRLAALEETADRRSQVYLELSARRAALGERAAAEAALVEAVATVPSPATLAQLATFCRTPPGGPDAHARALAAVVDKARSYGTLDAACLFALADVEARSLGRYDEAIEHAGAALQLRPGEPESRALVAFAASRKGTHGRAIDETTVLLAEGGRPLLALRDPAGALAVLESSLSAEQRHDEALVVRELRAMAGALDEATYVALRARRLREPAGGAAPPGALDRATLLGQVAPAGARHGLVEVGVALSGLEAKLLGDERPDMGLSSRDRIVAGTRLPVRAVFDRLLRLFGPLEVELAQLPEVPTPRILPLAPPWIVVPPGLAAQGDPPLTAALSRALARIALGAFWLDMMPAEQAHGWLVAAARQATPAFGRGSSPGVDPSREELERRLARLLGRREKKALASLEPALAGAPWPTVRDVEAATLALRQGAHRATFVVTGDLLSTLDDLRAIDPGLARATQSAGLPALSAVLAHPIAGDVCRFALTREATQLRKRVGSTWA